MRILRVLDLQFFRASNLKKTAEMSTVPQDAGLGTSIYIDSRGVASPGAIPDGELQGLHP